MWLLPCQGVVPRCKTPSHVMCSPYVPSLSAHNQCPWIFRCAMSCSVIRQDAPPKKKRRRPMLQRLNEECRSQVVTKKCIARCLPLAFRSRHGKKKCERPYLPCFVKGDVIVADWQSDHATSPHSGCSVVRLTGCASPAAGGRGTSCVTEALVVRHKTPSSRISGIQSVRHRWSASC